MELATALKKHTCKLSTSNITAINDQYRRKAVIVNHVLKELCKGKNINLIDYGKNCTA